MDSEELREQERRPSWKCLLLILLVALPFLCLAGAWLNSRRLDQQVRSLKTDVNHEEVAVACRAILKSADGKRRLTGWILREDPAFQDLPAVIRDLRGVNMVLIHPEAGNMRIEFGGGFMHYGFEVWEKGKDGHIKVGKDNPGSTLYEPLGDGIWWYVQP